MENETTYRLNETLRRSTVVVTSYYTLTGEAAPPSPPPPIDTDSEEEGFYVDGQQLCGRPIPPVEPVVIPDDLETFRILGNGFFFGSRGKDIITAATNVLIDPRQLANNNRYPFVSLTQPLPTGEIPNTLTKASRIVVSVNGVGSNNTTKNYEARLMAVDGAGNIAWLRICKPDGCPDRNLEYGESFKCPRGAVLYSFMGSNQFLTGSMVNNSYTSWNSQFQAEHIQTEFEYPRLFPGAPVVDENCHLVGMLTGENNGPSEDFMQYVTRKMAKLINSLDESGDRCNRKIRRRFTIIEDNLGDYYAFRKAYLGILWRNVRADTFITTVDPITGEITLDFNSQGLFDGFENCDVNQGIQIVTLAGNPNVLYQVLPGDPATPPFPVLPNSVLNLLPTDIILGFSGRNKKLVGYTGSCRAPGLYTWRINVCKKTKIYYVSLANTCNAVKSENNQLVYIPLALDYPYFQSAEVFPPVVGPNPPVAIAFESAPL